MSGPAGSAVTRQTLLVRGALATASAWGAATTFPAHAFAQAEATRDLDVISFALGLERLEATFYEQGIKRVRLGGEERAVAKAVRDSEREHVDILTDLVQQLGGTPAEAPSFDFGDAFRDQASFLELAQTLEDTGVSAYNGAAPLLSSPDVLDAAGAIAQVEARHAGVIRLLRGEPIAPAALDRALSADQVTRAVERYIRS